MAADNDGADVTALGGRPTADRELRPRGLRTVRKLHAAARRVLDDRGFHAMRVDDIVKAADTSHGTFYLYFENKDDLLAAMMRDSLAELERLAERLPTIGPDRAGRTALREWLKDFTDVYDREGPVIRAWLERREANGHELPRGAIDVLRSAFAAQLHEVQDDEVDADAAALAIVAMIERWAHLRQDGQAAHADLDTLATITHRGAFAG